MRIRITIVLFFCISCISVVFTQQSSTDTTKKRNAYGIWLLPSTRDNIYGVALGLIGSESICNIINTKNSHGINFQLFGQGLFISFNTKRYASYKQLFDTENAYFLQDKENPQYKYRAVHNGILISSFGTMTQVSNGIVLSAWFSLGAKMNGIAINACANKYTEMNGIAISISNESYKTNGVQIGIINRTKKLNGFQFGIWNVNQKRKLPLINWAFEKKRKA